MTHWNWAYPVGIFTCKVFASERAFHSQYSHHIGFWSNGLDWSEYGFSHP